MADDAVGAGGGYWAFISYSHKDAAFGRRLHRRLENYALPRRLVGRNAAQGPVPKRLVPIFRDRDELPAARDLSAEVRTAITASRSLVVICSPSAAQSLWVSREIELFRALHPDRPILAAIHAGEPGESLPEALRRNGSGADMIEPLAADFRRDRDGPQLGLLKLVAGIVGIGLDELVQRDATRRSQRVTAVTAAALTAMLGMGALTAFALNAQAEAERQRAGGEGLVRFMYTDLRDGLRGVGRLDLMAAVNQRALQYYDREIDRLPPASRAQRAQILLAMGDDDETRGDTNAAHLKIQEAWRTTDALLAAAPNDPDRIFDHAQSAYYMGFDAYGRGQFPAAKQYFQTYKWLAGRLVALAPNNPRYLRELGYAEGNLCVVAMKPPKDPAAALKFCESALAHMEVAARLPQPPAGIKADVANRQAWLADAYRLNRDNKDALAHRLIQEQMLDGLIGAEPLNVAFRSSWVAMQRVLARMEAEDGHPDVATDRLKKTQILLDQMIAFEPHNKMWREQKTKIDADMSKINQDASERAGQ